MSWTAPVADGDGEYKLRNTELALTYQGITDAHAAIAKHQLLRLASSSAVGASSVIVDQTSTGIAPGLGLLVIDADSTECEARLVSSVAGAPELTLTAGATLTSSGIGFVAATKRITGTVESISKFFPGSKITVTGSALNNGTYTVDDYPTDGTYDGTYITVEETLTNESAGPSVTLTMNLNRAHSAGAKVLWVPGPISVNWYGAKASGSSADAATNRLAIQRALDDAYWTSGYDIYLPGFLAGRYFIDAPLYIEKLTHLRGVHHKASVIAASSAFATWNDDVAMLVTRRNGRPCRFADGGNDRYYITHLGLDGQSVAYLKSTGFSQGIATGTGYTATGTNTFAIHASLVVTMQNANAIVFRALAGGTGGNAIRVAFVNDGASQPLSVTVAGNDITVHLATNGSSVVTSVAADIVAAVNAHGGASALVNCSVFATEDPRNTVAAVFSMTTLTAGTAPFAAGDVGRSIYISQKEGARNITAYVDAFTVTVDGAAFTSSQAGRKWAVSPVNGYLGSFNQTSRIIDVRIESCPGYNLASTGTQELTVHNLMSVGGGIHARLLGSQFVRFYETNFEQCHDAYVTFEDVGANTSIRSIHFIGVHCEGDVAPIDGFRVIGTVWDSINFITNYWTIHPGSTFLKIKSSVAAGSTYAVHGLCFSGPNTGPTFVDDASRGYTVPMTDFASGNNFDVPLWVVGTGNKITAAWQSVSKSTDYTARLIDETILMDATGGARTVTLPTAVGIRGKRYTVKRLNSGANAVTLDPNGAQTIDGAATLALAAQYDRATVESDGTNWMRVD